MRIVPEPVVFDWDKGNADKNLKRHNVSNKEAEEVFANPKHFLFEDDKHSTGVEKRYMLWGVTNKKRKLTIIFTLRDNKIRVISARDMHIKERRRYEAIKKTPNSS